MGNRVARTVGRYEIVEELGRGGMATVFLARQVDLDRLIALKELNAFRQSDPSFTQRFLRESRLAGSLSHPNIVTVHDYFESGGVPYIAMEYVARGSLRPHVGHLPLSQVAGVLEGILSALDHAEQRNIVHRDLKPENVMVTSDGHVKLTDFGIAKATGRAYNGSFLTAAGTTVGTPNYMAPEQAMGQDVGPWTDLYSVGVMAFEMFVGQVPFHDTDEPMAVLMRQVSDPIPPAHALDPDVDHGISDWIERLLVKEPEDRVQSAAEAWDQFEEIVLELAGPRWRRASRLPALSPRPADASRRAGTSRSTTAGGQTPTARMTPTTATRRFTTSEAPTHPVRRRDEAALAPTVMPGRRLADDDEPPAPARKRRRRGLLKAALVLLAALVALTAAFGGRAFSPGGSSGGTTARGSGSSAARASQGSDAPASNAPVAAAPTSSVTGRQLALRVPHGWSRLRSAPDLGLPLSGAVAVTPHSGSASPVVEFGVMKGDTAANSALLPAAFLDAIGAPAGTVPARTAVRLPTQQLQAWRYGNLRPAGTTRELTVYNVPTTGGVATVACGVSPGQGDAFASQCGTIAGTLELSRARPFPVGPSDAYASALNSAIGNLQQATSAEEATLQASRTLAGQAAAAQALAGGYETAAAQLADLQLSPADQDVNGQLVTALRRAGKAYRKAARAATAGAADPYRAASATIPVAKARVNAALAGVRAAGYQPAPGAGSPPASTPQGAKAPAPAPTQRHATTRPSAPQSDVGDSRSDDPSDDSADP